MIKRGIFIYVLYYNKLNLLKVQIYLKIATKGVEISNMYLLNPKCLSNEYLNKILMKIRNILKLQEVHDRG
jgi:hypothetical protein